MSLAQHTKSKQEGSGTELGLCPAAPFSRTDSRTSQELVRKMSFLKKPELYVSYHNAHLESPADILIRHGKVLFQVFHRARIT